MKKIVINVSGQLFVTTCETLARYPQTKLGKLAFEQGEDQEHFFDADEEVFREVLRYHRTGELHAPRNMCPQTFQKQLKFWGVEEVELEECCQNDEMSSEEIEKQFQWFEKRIVLDREPTLRDKVWYFMTDPTGPYTSYRKAAMAWVIFYTLIVIAQTLYMATHTLPTNARLFTEQENATYKTSIEMFLQQPCHAARRLRFGMQEVSAIKAYLPSAFFIVEITLRLITCPSKKTFFTSIHLLDFLIAAADAITHITMFAEWIFINLERANDAECLPVNILQVVLHYVAQLRCFRLLVLVLISSQLQVLMLALYASKKEIGLLVTVLGISCLIFSPAVFFLDMLGTTIRPDQQMGLDSILIGYWWVIVTMTTVGYGDYYPNTPPGYVMAAVVMLAGLMITALPIAIIGGNFSVYYEYNKKRIRKRKTKMVHKNAYKLAPDTSSKITTSVDQIGDESKEVKVGNTQA